MLIECFLDGGMDGDRGLVAGRSQREKRRSYKDLLREEEEIAAQFCKSSKKRPKVCFHRFFCFFFSIASPHSQVRCHVV